MFRRKRLKPCASSSAARIPLGRLAEAEDPARVVAWLLSEETAYMTGSHLVCDGGILAKGSISV